MQQEIINIDLILPTGWEDLTDKQLRYVFALLSQGFTATEVKAYCLFRWSGMQVMHRYGKGWYCKFAKDEFVLFAPQINAAIASLDWIDTLPTMPVRLAKIGSHRAVDAQFQGVPFETFIVCDNLYQGYLATKQDELLYELAGHLYSSKFRVESLGFRDLLGRLLPPYTFPLTQTERISVFYWFASLKGFLAKVFKHFFQPIAGASGADGNMIEHGGSQYEMPQNAVNAQIRALTKGDITKEIWGFIWGIKNKKTTNVLNNSALAEFLCDPLGARTQDPNIKSVVLYQLS